MPRLPSTTRRGALPDADAEARRINQEGACQRALMEFQWARARDVRARQTEQETAQPSAPAESPKPWWADLRPVAAPPEPGPEPFFDDYDIDDDDQEVEAEPVPPPTVAPINAGDVAERLEGLSRGQLTLVAEAFSEPVDGGEDTLRRRIMSYVEDWAGDRADEAHNEPEAAREAGRIEALGFVEEEIENAVAMPPSDAGEAELGE